MKEVITRWFLVLFIPLSFLGCGAAKYDVVPLEGTLTYEGQPVPQMIVSFKPEGKRASEATTDENGKFRMQHSIDQFGIEPGPQEVSVYWVSPSDDGSIPATEVQKKVVQYFRKNQPMQVNIEEPNKNFELSLPQ
ncbi:carboxypeptidase-like regulatory domain-containing protein [Blastopirellula sp. J2-11]|uniref:carboxypeptidase-like regulatory domain-containing protein n=1 Tax=Blastopirellula sp. J2-11 TaxID=2943192 RepID=UPI0021CA42A9|nr:carboxypeptidase-like regulatory domain-containing protein [Blastopirellula sp. J2-11]UUO04551.1 carboxypeptidase-like regulatory domain-containing protein [Blastopirellula sp. J2-11]